MEADTIEELAKEVVPPFLAISNVTEATVGQIICGDNRGIFLLTVEHQEVVEVPHSGRGFVAVAFHISDVLESCFVLQFCNDSEGEVFIFCFGCRIFICCHGRDFEVVGGGAQVVRPRRMRFSFVGLTSRRC